MWATDKTPDVVHAIYRAAVKGNPMSQMLVTVFQKSLIHVLNRRQKKGRAQSSGHTYTIEQLPEQLKQKHYGYLRELTGTLALSETLDLLKTTIGMQDLRKQYQSRPIAMHKTYPAMEPMQWPALSDKRMRRYGPESIREWL